MLERLTDLDLKEMGIAQLGTRRKILFALEKTIPINRMDLIAEMEEHEIHRQVVGEQDISVSTYRLVVGEESVLMSKIQSASVYTHVEPDHDAEATLQRAKAKANMRFLGGVSVLALSLTAVLLISEMINLVLLLVHCRVWSCSSLEGVCGV